MRCDRCPVAAGLRCPGLSHRIGPGPADWPFCRDVAAGLPGRAEQLVALAEGRPVPGAIAAPPARLDPAVRDAVLACPDRGPEGGLALLDEERSCCGGGDERTACAAGRGARPGRVTLRECLACRSTPLAPSTATS